MSPRKTNTARSTAARILTEAEAKKACASSVMRNLLPPTNQAQRTTDLVFGVIKNRALIDTVIENASSCPAERIPAKIINILRVAVYELVYCPQTARHAIVDEAVEQAKAAVGKKQAGFVNAVLRQTTRHIKNRRISLAPPLGGAGLEQADARHIIPQGPYAGCELDIPILPQVTDSPVDYYSSAFSLPRWLVKTWLDEYGEEKTRQICFGSNRRPSVYLRPNLLKTSGVDLAGLLESEGIQCEGFPAAKNRGWDPEISDKDMIRVKSPGDITKLPGFGEGLFTVQDPAAAQAVRLLAPKPQWRILDLCAAPGTKTTQLAEATQNKARIVATDIDSKRLEMVRGNIARLQLGDSIAVVEYERVDEQVGDFDCVLLDVPCSNTGVLAKRPEVRYRINERAIAGLAEAQIQLLRRAAELVKARGIICYSTCSIEAQENRRLVERFLAESPAFRLKTDKLILPSAERPDHDGSYAALITIG